MRSRHAPENVVITGFEMSVVGDRVGPRKRIDGRCLRGEGSRPSCTGRSTGPVLRPPLVHGRRIKLRYAHQVGRPPRIVIHGNQTASVPDAYTRYLSNVFRKTFDLFATPVAVEYRTDINPYHKPKLVKPREEKGRRKPEEQGCRATLS